jgi:L-amino acid N-acyltransferase YncA
MPSAGDPSGAPAEHVRAPVSIEPMTAGDWKEVRRIFVEGIATRDATFETEAPDWEEWDAAHLPAPRLVARQAGKLLGWAALSSFSTRPCYSGVAEVSIYMGESARGRGIGRSLLTELIRRSEAAGLWTLQAGIFPENTSSLALHRGCGFRVVGVRRGLGHLGGAFRDVVLLERRSEIAGGSDPSLNSGPQ